MAKLTADKPRSIIKKAQVNLTDEAAARMKRYPAQVQMMNRIRSTAATYGPNPISISDIIVPIPLSITYNKEPFVWKDSVYVDKDRIIIFTTENNIKLLINNKNWFGDGTFEVVPLIYQQMYNFSTSICGKILPMMYTLLPSKTEMIYLKLFKMFEEMPNFDPKEITIDFELAVTNALLKLWPYIIIFYCWFHYTQSLWRNFQSKKLA